MSQPEPIPSGAISLELRDRLTADIAAGHLELPVLPATAAAVLEAVRDENMGARRLADIIQRDQSMAAHLLRVANSPAFAAAQSIVSLPQAINRLGLGTVSEIATSVAVKGKIFNVPKYERHLADLWKHSAAAGAWAREIARLRRRNVEGAFLCGLLHDVGQPVLLQAVTELEKKSRTQWDTDTVLATVWELHAEVGAELVRLWALPSWMAEAIGRHHDPLAATEHREEALTTALAERLAHWALEQEESDVEELRGLEILHELNIYPEELQQLLAARECIIAITEAWG